MPKSVRYTGARGEEGAQEWDARGQFLSALVRVAPELLSSLSLQVGEEFRNTALRLGWPLDADSCENTLVEAISESGRRFVVAPSSETVWKSYVESISRGGVSELYGQLLSWASPYLDADWIHEAAIYTLHALAMQPWQEPPTGFLRPFDYSAALRPGERDFVFIVEDFWEPTSATRTQARDAITKQFEQELDKRMDESETRAKQRGFETFPIARELPAHCEWAARFQVHGHDFTSIGRDVGRTRETVSDAVNDLLPHLGLPERRKDPGGFPKGKKRPRRSW